MGNAEEILKQKYLQFKSLFPKEPWEEWEEAKDSPATKCILAAMEEYASQARREGFESAREKEDVTDEYLRSTNRWKMKKVDKYPTYESYLEHLKTDKK